VENNLNDTDQRIIKHDDDVADSTSPQEGRWQHHKPNNQVDLQETRPPNLDRLSSLYYDYSKGELMSNSASTDGK